MDKILPLPRDEIVRQTALLEGFNAVTRAYQQQMMDVLENLVKEGKYDIETIKTKCCVDVDEETEVIHGLDLSGLEVNGASQSFFCIGMRVPIGELTAEQWINMRVPVPKRERKHMCCTQ